MFPSLIVSTLGILQIFTLTDQNPIPREDLLVQRRQLYVLPPPCHQVPQLDQVPCLGKISLQRTIHWIHGCRCTSDASVWWNLRVSGRQEEQEGQAEIALRGVPNGFLG
jgi:hypothetical protein